MNQLFPIFLKLNKIQTLIVGGGNVATEKLSFMLKSSPNAEVEVVSKAFTTEILALNNKYEHVKLIQRPYRISDLIGKKLVIAATNDSGTNKRIKGNANNLGVLANVADTPAMCDFYLGGIVTKGNLKVAISTNGKSPTIAKRMRQLFEEVLPEDIDELILKLNKLRSGLPIDLNNKTRIINELTEAYITKHKIVIE